LQAFQWRLASTKKQQRLLTSGWEESDCLRNILARGQAALE